MNSFVVAMLGARMHYAVPRLLQEAGRLERFFTDLAATQGWPRLLRLFPGSLRPGGMNRILSRVPDGVPAERVTAFNNFGLCYARRRARASTPTAMTGAFLWANQRFGDLVSRSDWGHATAVFTFNCAGLEILQRAKSDGLFTVSEQTIAPSALEHQLLLEECALHPNWERPLHDGHATEYSEREQAEWPLADLILCGSEFVRNGIRRCGGPVGNCVVVSYGVNCAKQNAEIGKPKREGRLRVLTVGAVGLRKGAPYVLAAAKQLKGEAEFRWVGSVNLLPEAAVKMGQHVELTGSVPRPEMARHYEWADVFLLPSICEGSATVTYEALGHGLPIICTPNTGSVARHRVDGFIVPARDTQAIVEKLEELATDMELLASMSESARQRSLDYTLGKYGERLIAALRVARVVTNP